MGAGGSNPFCSTPHSPVSRTYQIIDRNSRVCAQIAIASGPGERRFFAIDVKIVKTYPGWICLGPPEHRSRVKSQLRLRVIRLSIASAGTTYLQLPPRNASNSAWACPTASAPADFRAIRSMPGSRGPRRLRARVFGDEKIVFPVKRMDQAAWRQSARLREVSLTARPAARLLAVLSHQERGM